MKNLKTIFFVLTLSLVVQGNAQQDPHFSLYRYNMNVITPAYAGTNEGLEALFSVRSQWVGVTDAPETFNFNINTPIKDKMGVGLSVVSDRVFVLEETHLYADFSYRIQISDNIDIHAGVKAGGTFLNVDLNKLGINNDALFTENINVFNPNVGVGFYLKAPKYYVTLSAPALLKNDRFEKEGVSPSEASDDIALFLGGGYDIKLSEAFILKPSVLSRGVNGSPVSLDLTTSGLYKERFEFGANYRLDESVTMFTTIGFLNRKLYFGYAYEITTSDVGDFNSNGSHEVILKFKI